MECFLSACAACDVKRYKIKRKKTRNQRRIKASVAPGNAASDGMNVGWITVSWQFCTCIYGLDIEYSVTGFCLQE